MSSLTITSGQTVSDMTFTNGDSLTVSSGGTSSGNIVVGPGFEQVYGSSLNDTVSAGGTSNGYVDVQSGGYASGTNVENGGSFEVFSGGVASNIVASGVFTYLVGGSSYSNPAEVGVGRGATLTNPTIGSGATLDSEGITIGGVILPGGTASALFENGGTYVSNLTVDSGASISVSVYAATGGLVLSGGTASFAYSDVYGVFNALAINTSVLSGSLLIVDGSDNGTLIASGGVEQLGPASSSTNVLISGGRLELTSGQYFVEAGYSYNSESGTAQPTGPITFAGTGGSLLDDGPVAPTSVISGFNTTDKILLAGVKADPNATLTTSGNIATVSAGGMTYALNIVGASSMPLTLGIGTNAGTIDIGVACYCVGTAILTVKGEVAIETIVPGDMVITARGQAEPVVWVGRRSYAGRFLRNQPHLLPIRIRAGALGRGLPRRDLLVSPNHALLLDRVLVPAGALVDGHRITVERDCPQVDYVHLELARHDVILAEGAAAETFIDDSSRGLFHTTQGTPGTAAGYCAPRHADGFAIELIRRRLAA